VTAVFLGVRAALPALEAGGGGSIVVLTAPAGAGVSGLHQVAYASATAAVTQFVRLTAVDHAERGVRANVVVRGWVDDELLDEVPPGVDPAERRARLATRVPAGRLGRPEEVAAVVAFLADDAAHYVSGTLIPVDGGLSARAPGSDPTEA
jgi:NAD(P)-dependent dehydrogenase (short-subunit alcohol dehydrogenase family)